MQHRRPPRPAKPAAPTLESTIGRNWTSWVGGIVVVLGALFFLQYAWEQGWLAFSPPARVAAAVVAGLALGLAGEWTHRRRMRALAGTLSGAGVAIVMAALFAAHALFDIPVLSARAALAGVCATAALAIWRAAHRDTATLAIIALVGAYLAPAILRTGHDESATLMTYLGALSVVGWALAYLRPGWAALRWFNLAATSLWVGAWVLWFPTHGQHRPLALLAVSFFLAGFLAEAFLTINKLIGAGRALPSDIPTAPRQARGFQSPGQTSRDLGWLENSLATISMLATAGAFSAFYAILPTPAATVTTFHLTPLAAIAVGLATLHALLALATPSKLFAHSSLLQAAALVTLAVPMTFGQVAVTLAWLTLAIAMAALGHRRRDNPTVRTWSIALLALAAARLFSLDHGDDALRHPIVATGDLQISRWLLIAWATAGIAHAMAWMTPAAPPASKAPAARASESPLGAILAAAGTVIFFAATALCASGPSLTLLWLAGVAALVTMARNGQRLAYPTTAAIALFVTAVKWLTADGLIPIAAAWGHRGDLPPIVNAAALAGAALIALTFRLGLRLDAGARAIAAFAVTVLAFALANFEALRGMDYAAPAFADLTTAKQAALSVLWAVTGLAAVVVGFARDLRPLRYAALALLGVTLAKTLLVDLAQVRPVYRILSFLAVGVLLLCVSFVYHRQEHGTAEAQH